ncbi:glycosyltransferase family 4 protein [Aetokthonos hydrillicola Thurmond2011]|jgi:glycosyltransferase involved in cell wall biosynthesis|uniref:Glycosyltransferase family 4 protein n=1 Tax=Aetokthonos hydrillicola Thurmond2011 TaxID=2712845 RepID=A0AAP5M8R7_9CYAN|nr:glycosyltransferase family 1 protein [Aetokthonos hydrillicola]MBO3458945.1 glycosyltransferase family 4 protein [Aetokthonos hydrillicola CCALA 1050]MBW4589052.1 glycosyltransferase family 4 protein [Aetokthonos hydrillicola CCALA 1050]MDR9894992.1 glycosyltransferase family 4 protein [Aetokthonos hydrillicola Thurmond2011]
MRVGIIFRGGLPEVGGGYTFSHEILESIANFCSHSSHSFIIFSTNKQSPNALSKWTNIEHISLYTSFKIRWKYRFLAIRDAVLKKLNNYKKVKFNIENWHRKFILTSLKNNNIDIIWETGPDCLTMEVPYIMTVWDLQHRMQPYFPEVSVKGEWDMREQSYATQLKRAAFVLTGTEAGKAEINQLYQVPAQRIKVLPFPTPGFALDSVVDDGEHILKKYNLPNNYLFYPAQFWPHKNHVGLLLAVKWLKDKYGINFPVVFTGSDHGNEKYVRQTVCDLDLSKQVYFLGFVPKKDLTLLYYHAFSLTFLTFFGPDNLPPLEAFALGCPVVASRVSGAEEQLGDAALLVDPKDTEEIALAIKSLWDDMTLRQSLIERGFVRANKWIGKDYIKGIFSLLDEFTAVRRCWSNTIDYVTTR